MSARPILLDPDWIWLRLATGHQRAFRRSLITGIGLDSESSYIEYHNHVIVVRCELEALAREIGIPWPPDSPDSPNA